jgi:hypothetical protein
MVSRNALMMEAAQSSETSVNSHQSTWRYNPEDGHLQHKVQPPDAQRPHHRLTVVPVTRVCPCVEVPKTQFVCPANTNRRAATLEIKHFSTYQTIIVTPSTRPYTCNCCHGFAYVSFSILHTAFFKTLITLPVMTEKSPICC